MSPFTFIHKLVTHYFKLAIKSLSLRLNQFFSKDVFLIESSLSSLFYQNNNYYIMLHIYIYIYIYTYIYKVMLQFSNNATIRI